MATYDRNLGVWRASDGSSGFATQAEAEAYEDTGVRTGPTNDTSSFGGAYDQIVQKAPEDRAPVRTAPVVDPTQRYYNPTAGGSAEADAIMAKQIEAHKKEASDAMHKRTGGAFGDLGRLTAYTAGAVANPVGFIAGDYIGDAGQAVLNPVGYATQQGFEQAAGLLPGGSGTGVGSSSPTSPSGTYSAGTPGIRTVPRGAAPGTGGAAAPAAYAENVAADQSGRDADRQTLADLYEQSRYQESDAARQSREQQQFALSKQGELYEMLANFDPDAYAQRASDLAMKNQLAIARSSTGGAAAASEGMFQALEAAPGINAEAQREGQQQVLNRQQLAAQLTGQMGELATGTRQQDMGEANAKSEFGLRIADGMSQAMGLDWKLDSQESATLANVALALDAQNIDWARLDLDAQIAEANRILAEAGLDQQWRQFEASQNISKKDLYGGLLTILGAGITGGFQIAAAKAGAPQRPVGY